MTILIYGMYLEAQLYVVTECYPFVEKGENKNDYGQAFAEAHRRSVLSMDELEKSLKSGGSEW